MFERLLSGAVVLVGSVSLALAQATGGPLFDGKIYLEALDGAGCAELSDQPGAKYAAVFRAKNQPGEGPAEAMSIKVPGGALFVTAILDETFEGRRQIAPGSFIVDGSRGPLPDAIMNLRFSSSPITEGTTRFRFQGRWAHFRAAGCTATVRGVFERRP